MSRNLHITVYLTLLRTASPRWQVFGFDHESRFVYAVQEFSSSREAQRAANRLARQYGAGKVVSS